MIRHATRLGILGLVLLICTAPALVQGSDSSLEGTSLQAVSANPDLIVSDGIRLSYGGNQMTQQGTDLSLASLRGGRPLLSDQR